MALWAQPSRHGRVGYGRFGPGRFGYGRVGYGRSRRAPQRMIAAGLFGGRGWGDGRGVMDEGW